MKNNKKEEFYNYIINCTKAEELKAEIHNISRELRDLYKAQDLIDDMACRKTSLSIINLLYDTVDNKYKALEIKRLQLKLQLNTIERNLLDFEYTQFLED